MILVTHEMAFARKVADEVIFMHKGRVVTEGTPADVVSRFQAGSMENVFIRIVRGGEIEDAAATEAESFWVDLPRHNLRFQVATDQTLLQALDANGIATLSDCQRGECGIDRPVATISDVATSTTTPPSTRRSRQPSDTSERDTQVT